MSGKRAPEITIYDRKTFSRLGLSGCNLGAGVIARSMIETLKNEGIPIPPQVIQNKIMGFSFRSSGRCPKRRTARSISRPIAH
jgi:hypothetical protein